MEPFVIDTAQLLGFLLIPPLVGILYFVWKVVIKCIQMLVVLVKKLQKKREDNAATITKPKVTAKERLKTLVMGRRRFMNLPLRFVLIALYLGFGALLVWNYYGEYFTSRPNITYSNAFSGELYTDEKKPIITYFDKPIDNNLLLVKTAPEDFTVSVSYYSPFERYITILNQRLNTNLHLNIYTGISISPNHSIPYDTGLIYYVTGISSITGKGGSHESAFTLSTPKLPKLVNSNIVDLQKDVSISTPIEIVFDQPILRSLNYSVSLKPEAKYTVTQIDSRKLLLTLDEPLNQGRNYNLEVAIKTRDINFIEGKEDETSDEMSLYAAAFKTVTPPGIKDISPEGSAVIPSSKVRVTFNEPINPESVTTNISISPGVPFTSVWVKEKEILELTFGTPLAKATKYTLTLGKNIQSMKGGMLERDIAHKFETVGYVKISGYSPSSGSRNVSTYSPIQITFDQQVDKTNAQSKVTISPSVSMKYSWKGNTLKIAPKSAFNYSTKYTVTIKPDIKSVYGLNSKNSESFSFTTRSQIIQISVPAYKQGYSTFDCNVVSLQMALAAKGVSASTSAIKSSIGYGTPYNSSSHTGGNPNSDWINYYGVHWDPIAQYARSRGRTAEVKRGWSLSGIAKEISKGNPVVIFWYNGLSNTTRNAWHYEYGSKPGLHSVVVYGFKGEESNPTGLYIHDPWPSFYQEYYTAGSFNSKWSYFGYTAVVVK